MRYSLSDFGREALGKHFVSSYAKFEVLLQKSWGVTTLLLLLAAAASGQSDTNGSTPLGLAPGAPAGSYSLSGFDNVNLFNGNLNFQLPLLGVSGRGGARYQMTLPIDQTWTVFRQKNEITGVVTHHPEPNWWEGIKPGYGPGVVQGRHGGDGSSFCGQWNPFYRYTKTLTRLTFTAADGTEFELRDQLTAGEPKTPPSCFAGFSRGRNFISADGSSATFISDSDILDTVIVSEDAVISYSSGYLMLRDGTRYRIDSGKVTWMRDRNGNKLSFTYDGFSRVTTITDSLNRQVTIVYDVNDGGAYGVCDRITYSGFGGGARTIRVSKTAMGNVLRSGYSLQTYRQLFPELNGSNSTLYNPTVVGSVWLPDSDGVVRRYQFFYNSYGELARVVLPTGGAFEYDYMGGFVGGNASGAFKVGMQWHVHRRVVERRVYPDGATLESKMTSSRPESMSGSVTYLGTVGYVVVDHLNSAGTLLARQQHYFYRAVHDSFFTSGIEYPAWKFGREHQTEAFDANGTTVMRRATNVWEQRAAVSWWTGTADSAPPNDPRVNETDGMWEPSGANLVSKHTFSYDDTVPYNNQSDVYEYDFGVGAAGALVRRTHTDYLTSSSYTGTDVHLRSLPVQTSIYDAGGIERARAGFEYDNYTPDTNHAALLDRTGISGLDSSFTTSYITRGNATATTHYLLNSSGSVTGSISAYAQYDIAGNVTAAIDPRGNATTFGYADCFGAPDGNARINSGSTELNSAGQYSYALLTSATNAANQTAFAQYDYYTGKAVDGEDANGTVASGYFNDLLDRPTQIVRAANQGTSVKSQTTFSYDDTNRIVTTTSDQSTYGDNALKGQMIYDGLGRAIESRQYEGGTNYTAGQTQYDALGRAFKGSNPFRPWQSESAVWTTSAFDALGRMTSVTTPDSAVVSTAYSGNTVTVTDQAGKARKSVTDALGRLTTVYEDPSGLNYQTSYSYDVLNDLTGVSQDSQSRTFVYDSLKRLSSATNPESGTVTYQYDDSGNLLHKTDARGVVSTYVYDALNRATTRSYSDGTPAVTYSYDSTTIAYGKGRLASVSSSISSYSYSGYDALGRVTGGAQTIGAQSYSVGYSYDLAGHVLTETYPSGRIVTNAYDSAGRTTSVTGNLGDGTSRTYATGISYSSFGGITREQYGTTTPLYLKTFYNIRGQMFDTRLSSVNDTWDWNRGRQILYYSSNHAWGGSGTDNNGNVIFAENWVPPPNATLDQAQTLTQDSYTYDALNRLSAVNESSLDIAGGGAWTSQFAQVYSYDRYGNRTIDQANTWGTGIPKPNFGVDTSTNRLTAPAGYTMSYDSAGNLSTDTFTGEGTRTYDAENRMKQAWSNNQWQTYTYDGDGHRVRRSVNGTETWQVYGLGGELLAEYAANAAASSPQKEYGYRNGQLLVTAEPAAATHWLVTDQLGTPRMVFDQTGSLAGVSRHDYLPFGEELFAGTGGRTIAQGYVGDNVRQKFTRKERDNETGLDYFLARYYSSTQGRFTSPDPLLGSGNVFAPQSWNRFVYAANNPLKFVDPLGLYIFGKDVSEDQMNQFEVALDRAKENLKAYGAKYGTDNKEYKKQARALEAYGEKGVQNGVTVLAATDPSANPGGTQVAGVAGQKTSDNPTGQDIRVTFNPNVFAHLGFNQTVSHEGSHVADGSEWVSSGFDPKKNPTLYQTELDAFTVSALQIQADYNFQGEATQRLGGFKTDPGTNKVTAPYSVTWWNSGWAEADRATMRTTNINKILAEPPVNGGYGVTPANQGDPVFKKGSHF